MSDFNTEHQKITAAVTTLEFMRYTWTGGIHWRPPVGKKPDFDLMDSLQAEVDRLAGSLREECSSHSNTIDGRDRAADAADSLANAIASHFQTDIGEHSNLNCPWQNALECIENSEQQRWIAVGERLPSARINVLGLTSYETPVVVFLDLNSDWVTEAFYSECGQCGTLLVGEITHWMPLPALPTREDG